MKAQYFMKQLQLTPSMRRDNIRAQYEDSNGFRYRVSEVRNWKPNMEKWHVYRFSVEIKEPNSNRYRTSTGHDTLDQAIKGITDHVNVLTTGGIPTGTLKGNVGPLTEDEEKTIRIKVIDAVDKLRGPK